MLVIMILESPPHFVENIIPRIYELWHNLDTLPSLDDWIIENSAIPSRCGFCKRSLKPFNEWSGHLAGHFCKAATIKDWRSELGFPHKYLRVLVELTNSQNRIAITPTKVHHQMKQTIKFLACKLAPLQNSYP